jgi:hypothetical protein
MWEILDISIPAVVLIPVVAIGVLIWMCLQQHARSGDVRRAEFQRLQRIAMEEHARAERELEQEYMRHKPVDSPGVDYSPHRRVAPGNGYGNDRGDVGLGGWRDPHEGETRRRKLVEDEERRQKQGDVAFNRRRLAEEEEDRRRQAAALQETELNRRKQLAAEELRAEIEERKRREAEDEKRRRQTEEQDWQRRRADLEAQARREAEEERRRLAIAEEEERQRRWKQEEAQRQEAQRQEAQRQEAQRQEAQRQEAQRQEAQRQEAQNFSPRTVQPSGLTCVVCHKPTKSRRRCSRCKSMNYWYVERFRKSLTVVFYSCFPLRRHLRISLAALTIKIHDPVVPCQVQLFNSNANQSNCVAVLSSSKECQVQHWNDGHKSECRPVDANPSPRSSVDGDTRNFSDFNSPRSNK